MKNIYILFLTIIIAFSVNAQEKKMALSLDDVIRIASLESIDAFRNKNMYRASYWEYRYFKADKLPSLTLDATPFDFNRYRYKDYNFQTNEEEFVLKESLGSEVNLSLSQNIALTGGRLFLSSGMERIKNFSGNENTLFKSTPISIGYSQDLTGYNALKWDSKIEPLKFEKAKKQLIQSNEVLAWKAATRFFNLAEAQIELSVAEKNLAISDTLYKISSGRFQVGTVTQNDLLSMELRLLNSKQALSRARTQVQRYQSELNSFLSMDKSTEIECIVPFKIPPVQINADDAVSHAITNNPEMINLQQRMLEADETVARRKAEAGFRTSIFALYGLDQSSANFDDAFKDPDNSQRLRVGMNIPIVDWGKRKGRYQMAKYNREVEMASIEQAKIDFEQGVFQDVIDFNLQAEQVRNAAVADTVAQKGYEVALQRFLIGKIELLNWNQSRVEMEQAKKSYIGAIREYWRYYYSLRIATLFDFIKNETLSAEYDSLLQK